ncbi:MAG: peptidylprolyl isomerase [Ignavibacteriales bacterium]|nr:peptidylprolyl isomerase [Ignavibacteriales bacterium]
MKGRQSSFVSSIARATFLTMLALGPLKAQQNVVDRIVAVVDKEIITESDVQERITYAALQNRLDPKSPDLRRQVLENLIAEKLMLAQAILDSVAVTEEEVTRSLDQQFQNFVKQAGSEQQLEKVYGKPVSRMKREFRPEMRKQLLIQRLRQQREQNLSVARREVEEFFEAYKDSLPKVPEEVDISHIFIVPKADTSLENKTRLLLNALRDSIVAGGDFAGFARRYSQDPNGATGGDLGWAKRGVAFVPEFEEAVFALKEKEISPVVKTEFGFHLIQLFERRGESVHARHILLRTEKGPASDSAAVHLLGALRDSILQGKSLAELARRYSEDEDTKSIGGDLGQISVDQLEADFSSVVKNLKPGEISQPHRITMKNSYGYQIVLLKKRVAAHSVNLTDDYRRTEQMALYVKRNKMNAAWLEELKKSIYCEIRTQE